MEIYLDHVAVLVPTIEVVKTKLERFDLPLGPIESFPGEGTREMYVGPKESSARLLVVEAANPEGPYARALKTRGPGIHHIAINVPALEPYIDGLQGSGWFLLPHSLKAIREAKTAWLGRPGVDTLVEVHQNSPEECTPFITNVSISKRSGPSDLLNRLAPLGCRLLGVTETSSHQASLTIGSQLLSVPQFERLNEDSDRAFGNADLDIWHVAIPVRNLGLSVEFYREKLGLNLTGYDEYPSKKQAFVCTKSNGFSIELFEPLGEALNDPRKLPDHIAFEINDLARYREQLVERGLASVGEVVTFDNGVKHIGLQDPDGVTIDLFQGRRIYEQSISGR
jgi:catechol 2,3-dioxygenase-like lactoylglutathione lyase family enzyme